MTQSAGSSALGRGLARLEAVLFGHRGLVLGVLAVLTVVMGWLAVQLRMDAGFEKQMPLGHEYIETFKTYRDDLLGANRLTIVLRARSGKIWTQPGLTRLYELTQAVTFLPSVSRGSVQSLWTPNSFVNEITEEGFRADPIIPGTITPDKLDAATIETIARTTALGGYVGTLVARDQTSAMVTVELNEYDASGAHIDYVAYNRVLEDKIRAKFEDKDYEVQIIGFAKQIGDIADGASAVLAFCVVALLLTAAAVYWYCHSLRFTLLPLACSLTSLVWQFGTLRLLGYTDPFVGRLAFFRAYSGRLDSGSYVLNTRTGKKERISRIMQMHANKQNPVDFIEAGDIGAAVGFKDIKTGDTLCNEDHPIVLESMTFPEPVISIAIEPKTQADVDKMGMAIAKLVEEDPTLRVRTDEETGQTILSGMGELHLEIIVDRMKREFKVEINQGAPMVAYKESFKQSVQHRETYKKQTGGRGKFGDIAFEIGPADAEWLKENPTGGLQFVNEIFGGSIPKEFIAPILKGFTSSMTTGVLAGYPVVDMKVRIFDGSYHDVDSDAISFELCAKQGYREAGRKAKPTLLEPIMKVEVLTPDQYMGDVTGDLNRRRGMLEGMDSKHGVQVIKAKVPLSEMFGYVTQLRSLSSGRATSTMEFSHYAPAPNNVAEEIIAKSKGKMKVED